MIGPARVIPAATYEDAVEEQFYSLAQHYALDHGCGCLDCARFLRVSIELYKPWRELPAESKRLNNARAV